MACTNREVFDQPAHLHSLIKVSPIRINNLWIPKNLHSEKQSQYEGDGRLGFSLLKHA